METASDLDTLFTMDSWAPQLAQYLQHLEIGHSHVASELADTTITQQLGDWARTGSLKSLTLVFSPDYLSAFFAVRYLTSQKVNRISWFQLLRTIPVEKTTFKVHTSAMLGIDSDDMRGFCYDTFKIFHSCLGGELWIDELLCFKDGK